jgi:peptidoglycan-associated lipoprotein
MKKIFTIALLTLLISTTGCSKFKSLFGRGDDNNIPSATDSSLLSDINFDFDSSDLSETAKAILADNAKWIMDNTGSSVIVEGHCDDRGTAEYNLALGERRARSAMDYLVSLGASSSQLNTVSYGEELPLDPSNNEDAWARNRRAHFAVK